MLKMTVFNFAVQQLDFGIEVQHLDFKGQRPGPEAYARLAAALDAPAGQALRVLKLAHCNLDRRVLIPLFAALAPLPLRTLVLSDNWLAADGTDALARALTGTTLGVTLTTLDVARSRVSGAAALASALASPRCGLRSLDLSGNFGTLHGPKLKRSCLVALLKAMKRRHAAAEGGVETLGLHNAGRIFANQAKLSGARALAKLLGASGGLASLALTLEEQDDMVWSGAKANATAALLCAAIAAPPSSARVHTLDLSLALFSASASGANAHNHAELFAALLALSGLTRLTLRGGEVARAEESAALATLVRRSPGVTHLELLKVAIAAPAAAALLVAPRALERACVEAYERGRIAVDRRLAHRVRYFEDVAGARSETPVRGRNAALRMSEPSELTWLSAEALAQMEREDGGAAVPYAPAAERHPQAVGREIERVKQLLAHGLVGPSGAASALARWRERFGASRSEHYETRGSAARLVRVAAASRCPPSLSRGGASPSGAATRTGCAVGVARAARSWWGLDDACSGGDDDDTLGFAAPSRLTSLRIDLDLDRSATRESRRGSCVATPKWTHLFALAALHSTGLSHLCLRASGDRFAAELILDVLRRGRVRSLDVVGLRGVPSYTLRALRAYPLVQDPGGRCKVAFASVFNLRCGYDGAAPRRICAFYERPFTVRLPAIVTHENAPELRVASVRA